MQITGNKINNTYTFGKNNNAYYLNLGTMVEGEYSFTAKTTYNNKEYKQSNRFVISANNLELSSLTARHSLLYTLSTKTNAQMLPAEDILNLEDFIKQNGNIKPIIHINHENKKFISLWWYWLLITLSFGSEWLLRKYWGRV